MPNDIANNMADTIRFLEEENARLTESHIDLQLAYNEQMIELREAKRLLKLAVEDINFAYFCFYGNCKNVKCEMRCPYYIEKDGACSTMSWRYYGEAMKILKEE